MLSGLAPVADRAHGELDPNATHEEISAHAIRVNVFNTMDKLLEYSEALREKVRAGKVQVHGAIYDLHTGEVEFLGQSRALPEMMDAHPAFFADSS